MYSHVLIDGNKEKEKVMENLGAADTSQSIDAQPTPSQHPLAQHEPHEKRGPPKKKSLYTKVLIFSF